jgi:hypothetical protein
MWSGIERFGTAPRPSGSAYQQHRVSRVAANFAILLRGPRCTNNIKLERAGTSAHLLRFAEFTRCGVVQVVQAFRVEDGQLHLGICQRMSAEMGTVDNGILSGL